MTIIELMVAAGVLVITSVGGYSGFLLLNRQAANMRNMSMARALCQERIEQALTLPFDPTASTPSLPTAPSSDPAATADRTILGTASNYTSGALAASTQTSTESIPISTKSESTAASPGATVVYTRTSSLTAGGLSALGTDGSTSTKSLNTVLFTVNVSWTFRGSTYATSMSTLRAPD